MGLTQNRNPFFVQGRIEDERFFWGREKELREIFGLLDKSTSHSVSIVGPRNIGKSSLLRHLTRPNVKARFLPSPDKLVTVYVDFRQLAYYSEVECLQKVLWEVQATLSLSGVNLPKAFKIDLAMATPRALSQALSKVCRYLRFEVDKTLIFLFDDFEISCQNPHLSIGFFNTLRAFASSYGVGYVTATREELSRLPIQRRGRSSPFFNYFTTLYLGLFSDSEARELVSGFSAATGVDLERDIDFVLERAGRHPFFLQGLCWHIWDQKAHRAGLDPTQAAYERFQFQVSSHFDFYWSSLDSDEQALAQDLDRGHSTEWERSTILASLERKALVELRDNGEASLISEALRAYIRSLSLSQGESH